MAINPNAPEVTETSAKGSSWLSMLTGATVVGAIVAAIAYAPEMADGLKLDEEHWVRKAADAVAPAGQWLNTTADSLKGMLPEGIEGMEGMKEYITGKTLLATAGVAAGGLAGLVLKPHHVDEAAGHALPHALAHMNNGHIPTI